MLLGAEHVRDAHQRVVDGNAKVVDGQAVGAQDDKVADGVGVELDLAADNVVDDDVAVGRDAEAEAVRGSLGELGVDLFFRGLGPLAAVDRGQGLGLCFWYVFLGMFLNVFDEFFFYWF